MGTAATLDEHADDVVLDDERTPGRDHTSLAGGVLVVVAALLSLPRLGVRSLWLDETYTVGASNQLVETLRHTSCTQALYYVLVWPVSRFSTDPALLRLPSALLGLAAVVVVLRVGRRLGGPRVAVLAAGGLAVSWGLARYSVEARAYTLALLLVSTSWLALIAALQADGDSDGTSRRWWRTFYVVSALVPLAHGLATLNFVAQLGALAIAPNDRRLLVRRALAVAPVLAVELAAMFLLGASDVGDWVPPLSMWQAHTFKQLMLGFGVNGMVIGAVAAVAVVDVVVRYGRERSREAWLQVLPVFWALGPAILIVLLSLVRPYAAARYVFPSLPALYLLIAGLVVRHLVATWRIALAALVLALPLLRDQRHVTTDGIEDWSGLTACIAANSAPGDRLLTAPSHRSALDYYWPDHPELSTIEPLSPPEPLGQVRRLYETRTPDYEALISVMLEDTSGSIWYVDRLPSGRLGIVGLAFDEQLATGYRIVDPWYFEGDLTLTRLDPVGSHRHRGDAPCTVAPTPADMQPAAP